jgi:hypothetical protein
VCLSGVRVWGLSCGGRRVENSGEHGGGSASDGRPNFGDDKLISEPAGDGLRAGMTLSGTILCIALVVKSTGASTAGGTTGRELGSYKTVESVWPEGKWGGVELEGEDSEECSKLESSRRYHVPSAKAAVVRQLGKVTSPWLVRPFIWVHRTTIRVA